jgi:large subunit ribosomal protein L9
MEVILKEDVAKLGSRGDVVKVAEGYGRNYLLPRKLAIEATPGNKAVIEQMKASAVRRSAKEKGEAEQLAKQFEADIATELEHRGFKTVDRRKIHLSEPLKALGEFTVPVKLHRDVTATVQVEIVKEAAPE